MLPEQIQIIQLNSEAPRRLKQHYPAKTAVASVKIHIVSINNQVHIPYCLIQPPPRNATMVFKKRKANEAELSTAPVPKRGRGRPANTDSATPASLSPPKHKSSHNALRVQPTATSSRPKRNVSAAKEIPKLARSSKSGGVSKPVPKPTRATVKTAKAATPAAKPKKASEKAKISKAGKNNSASTLAVKPKKSPKQANTSRKLTQTPLKNRRDSNVSVEIPHIYTTTADHVDGAEDEDPEGPSYWLMKAEPESRIEKGKDVKFSIDDLRNTTEPEAWDGKFSCLRDLSYKESLIDHTQVFVMHQV